jgi:REP element-mobilizing transposase RayT
MLHTPITLRRVPLNERPLAKPVKASYRRNLPHLQVEDKPLFVTFVAQERWVLPECVRDKILQHCLHDHGVKLHMFGAIVMPDHVHLVFEALRDPRGNVYGLAEIMSGIKGASAHSVNKVLGRNGQVWQDESYDHVCRCNELPHETAEYICQNPVRKGLVSDPDQYRWLWREWIEGQLPYAQT